MKIRCFHCGKPVSSEVPEGTVLRAVAVCPECTEKRPERDKRIKEMDKAIMCLALEVPSSVHLDIKAKWDSVKEKIS